MRLVCVMDFNVTVAHLDHPSELMSREKAHPELGTSGSQLSLLETSKALSFKTSRGVKLAKRTLITS